MTMNGPTEKSPEALNSNLPAQHARPGARALDPKMTDDFMKAIWGSVRLVAIANIQKKAAPRMRLYRRIFFLVWLVVLLLLVGFLALAWWGHHHERPFEQLVAFGFFGETLTFALAPMFLWLASKSRVLVLVVALAAAAGLAIWAYPLGDPWRHIGLEGCITLGMLVILDLGIKALLEHLEKEKKAV